MRRKIALAVAAIALLHASWPAVAQYSGYSGKIAFARFGSNADAGDIYTAGSNGLGLANLTKTPGSYSDLDWSADGKMLAFQRYVAPNTEIWVIRFDGSGMRRVSPAGVSRYHPSWSPDGRYLAVDDGQRIRRLDVTTGQEVLLKDRETYDYSCLDQPFSVPVLFSQPSWSPDGARMAVVRSQDLPPLVVGSSCDPNVFVTTDIGIMSAFGGDVVRLIEDPYSKNSPFDTLPDWSPDGTKIAWQRGNGSSVFGIAVAFSGGGGLTQLANGFGARPRWSPDGDSLLITRDSNNDGNSEVFRLDLTPGSPLTPLVEDGSSNLYQDWQPSPANGLQVKLEAVNPDGVPIEGSIALAQTVVVELHLRNNGTGKLGDFEFVGGDPLTVDDRSTAQLRLVSGPSPYPDPKLELEPDEEMVYRFELTAESDGVAAAYSKVTARNEDEVRAESSYSLRFDVADGAELTDALGRWCILQAMDALLQHSFGQWYSAMAARAGDLAARMRAVMSPEQQQQWFGGLTGLRLDPVDFATGVLRAVPPEMAAVLQPKQSYQGHSVEELNRAYDQSFRDEIGKGVSEWVEGWASLGSAAKKGLQDSWSEAMLTSFYVFGTATAEERSEFEAYSMALLDGVGTSSGNLVNTVKDGVVDWQNTVLEADEALDNAVADAFLLSPDIQAQMATESQWRQNMIDMAANDPVGFQKEWAKRDAEIANLVLPVVVETLIGGGIFKAGGTLGDAVLGSRGAAMMRAGEAAGVLEDGGAVTSRARTAMKPASSARPRGPSLSAVAESERSGGYIGNVEGATIVQSSDVGEVYALPNVGGVPEVTLDAKAGILRELEEEYLDASGKQLRLAEVLKPSSELRKADGVAKLELTAQKTGKPAMLDAGAPKEVLAEASVWRSSTHPRDLPGFSQLSKARQEAAIKEWKLANEAWEDWMNPPPGSKTERLKQCIGQRSTVPLDAAPNKAGLQRFVTAEFEEVPITSADGEARLIRAKYYEVKVVDTNKGITVNSKKVVDLPEAVPQTPDADGVALAKVIGEDAQGNPILAPLSRSEREFVMQRYIDKNVKARRLPAGAKGAIPDLAEHGVTLVMDDASATAAGKLLARHGTPFLPKNVGLAYLRRIAPFVAKAGSTPEQVAATYRQLLEMVRSEGGFGRHAIVVTGDTRYLGEVNFADW